jgi:hypothetical protein
MAERLMEPRERHFAAGWRRRRPVDEGFFDPIEGPAPFNARCERRSRRLGGIGATGPAHWRRRQADEQGFDPIDGPAPFGATAERRSQHYLSSASA